jgi:hypothetical protein
MRLSETVEATDCLKHAADYLIKQYRPRFSKPLVVAWYWKSIEAEAMRILLGLIVSVESEFWNKNFGQVGPAEGAHPKETLNV